MHSSAMLLRSPMVSSMSISRPGWVVDTALARAMRLSVSLPMALTTTTTSWPWRRVKATFSATARIRSASATEVPPYFWTMSATASTVPDHRHGATLVRLAAPWAPPSENARRRTASSDSRSCSASSGATARSGGSSPGPSSSWWPARPSTASRCWSAAVTTTTRPPAPRPSSHRRRRPRCSSRPRCPARPSRAPTPCPNADGTSPRTITFAEPPPMCIDPAKTYTATVVTNKGEFTVDLDAAKAPQTVNNFVVLSRYHYYDGVLCHRIIDSFVVQCGDPTGTGSGPNPGYTIPDELPCPGRLRRRRPWPWPTPARRTAAAASSSSSPASRAAHLPPHLQPVRPGHRGLRHDGEGAGSARPTPAASERRRPTARAGLHRERHHHRSVSGSRPRERVEGDGCVAAVDGDAAVGPPRPLGVADGGAP